ncbi:MAG TPA: hypothetical protein VF175_02320 [Lacipirellula sp.]
MARVTFSLRTFLLFATAAVLLLGYGQYRRQRILTVCEELNRDGYYFMLPSAWHDRIWQRKPTVGEFVHAVDGRVRLKIWRRSAGGSYATFDDEQGAERLKNLDMIEHAANVNEGSGFTLQQLVLIVAAAGLLLAYGQYRRLWILNVCTKLENDGYIIDIPRAWHDYIWQRKPTVGSIFCHNGREKMSRPDPHQIPVPPVMKVGVG